MKTYSLVVWKSATDGSPTYITDAVDISVANPFFSKIKHIPKNGCRHLFMNIPVKGDVYFSSLISVGDGAFYDSFASGTATVHFPKALEGKISYPTNKKFDL